LANEISPPGWRPRGAAPGYQLADRCRRRQHPRPPQNRACADPFEPHLSMPKKTRKRALPPGAKASSRIWWRNQGGALRAYADLRDMGGGRRALIAPDETQATTDPEIAESLLTKLMTELEEQKRNRVLLGLDPEADLAESCIEHVQEKEDSGEYDERWLEVLTTYLARAVSFFTRYQRATEEDPEPEPQPRNIATISVSDIREYAKWLKTFPNGRGGYLGAGSRRHHLTALSGVFERAISNEHLAIGKNPVRAMAEMPTAPKSTTIALEVDELALLLESARVFSEGPGAAGRLPCAYEVLATFILTGARESEIRRLEIRDLDFKSESIDIRGTKTEGSDRTMAMHPQLREILLPYVERLGRTKGLLFTTDAGEPFGDWRKTLDAISARAGFPKGTVRTRMFRTSYITHRLACIDQGAPIEPYKVAREVGHNSLKMIMRIYGRVQRRRVRMTEFEFRIEAIGPEMQDRLLALGSPPPPRQRGGAELLKQFLAATATLSSAEITAATGIPKPTVNRFRAGQTSVQGKTADRMRAYLDQSAGKSQPSDLRQPSPAAAPRERRLRNRAMPARAA
jgi:integrase